MAKGVLGIKEKSGKRDERDEGRREENERIEGKKRAEKERRRGGEKKEKALGKRPSGRNKEKNNARIDL
ncbi:MAG: hypothetical protein LBR53_01655 [Deltaproteobacteria bacterium]|jgi:hypothetical protein|nr:hypothetical protein [Deltaproteobacteria bacterium]